MTVKEIIDGLKFTVDMFLFDGETGETYTEPRNDLDKITVDACKGAIELLEQESCEDAISRQAVDELSKELVHTTRDKADFLCNFWERLQKLPSVTPQPKMGHWINHHIIANTNIDMIVCSRCGEEFSYDAETGVSEYYYCPNCGAKMESEVEDANR